MLRAVDDVPVIVATARDGDPEIVAALDAGADDYVVKPFSGAQLHARIGAVLRRAGADAAPTRRWSWAGCASIRARGRPCSTGPVGADPRSSTCCTTSRPAPARS